MSSGGLRKLSIGSTPVAGRPRFFCKADTDVLIFSSYKNCAGQTRGSNLSSALTTTELPRVLVPSKHVRERVDYDEPRLDAADDGDEPAPDGGCRYQPDLAFMCGHHSVAAGRRAPRSSAGAGAARRYRLPPTQANLKNDVGMSWKWSKTLTGRWLRDSLGTPIESMRRSGRRLILRSMFCRHRPSTCAVDRVWRA